MNKDKIIFFREISVIISTVITLFMLFVKIFSNVFKESIKSKFKYVPEDDSLFNLILQMITHIIGSIIYCLVLVVIVLVFYISIKNGAAFSEGLSKIDFIGENKTDLVAILIFFLHLALVLSVTFCFTICYSTIKSEFINKIGMMEWKKVKIKKRSIFVPTNGRNIKKMIWYNRIAKWGSAVINSLYLFMLFIVIESNEEIPLLSFLSALFLIVFYLAVLIISVSLDEIIEVLAYDNKYEFILANDKIICKCFLEYKNYYLIYQPKLINGDDSIERYIRKTEVKEIKKICGDKIVYNKTKKSIKKNFNGLIKKTENSFMENTNENLES